MKVFLTGATGVLGTHLIDYILENNKDYEMHAIKRPRTKPYKPESVKYYDCDITDYLSLSRVINEVKPEKVWHLASQSYPKIGESNPILTVNVNVNGTLNLLEAIRSADYIPSKIIIVTSASVYGNADKFPTSEDTEFKPVNLYGVTKVTQDRMGYQYYMNYGLPIILARPYIQVGVRQGNQSSINSFCEQIAKIRLSGTIEVGNLSSSRDFLSAKNCANALFVLSEHGVDGEAYNICSGIPRKMSDILDRIIGMSSADIKIAVDKNKLRKSDIPLELGDNSKLKSIGWEMEEDFYSTLRDILDYWRYGAII